MRKILPFLALLLATGAIVPGYAADNAPLSNEAAAQLLKTRCLACHQGKNPAGGLNLMGYGTTVTLAQHPDHWKSIATRVHNSEMPPKGAPEMDLDTREKFVAWVHSGLRAAACAEGVTPGPSLIRRLNRAEYSATIRDLLNIHLDVGAALPDDGAGGEGFDNAAETLFLSPIHAEKYMESAKLAISTAMGDARTRAQLMTAKPGPGKSDLAAAREILENLLPRAFRRTTTEIDTAPFLALYQSARKRGDSFDESVALALRAILISPDFLFRSERPNNSPNARQIDDFALASRLSYFLWGTMPDNLLFDIARQNKLHDPEILDWQITRMLRHPKSLDFVTHFVEQWLGTRELGKAIRPDAQLFPVYSDEEIQSDIRYQPVMFFRELLVENLSLLNLLDSKFTFTTRKLQRLYGLNIKTAREANAMPQRIELPAGSDRGGLLGMSAILAVSSHPQRTSPVLRGKWLLDSILGTPPPPPPPNVPELKQQAGAAPQTLREMLTQHRADPTCAGCHARIDPLGFALENYDVLGRWRTEDAGKPVDATGELPDGTKFNGPAELKAALMDRKDLFITNLTRKMLGYSLGRGLVLTDYCTVDGIVESLKKNDYSARTLIKEVIFSKPFQYQSGLVSKNATPEKRASQGAQ